MSQWCVWKTFAALKLIAHPENIPPISIEELDRFDEEEEALDDEQRVVNFLRFIYAKSNKKLEIYGKVDEMFEVFENIDKIPLYVRFSVIQGAEMGSFFFQLSTMKTFEKQIGGITFTSKYDIAIHVYNQLINTTHSTLFSVPTKAFYSIWTIALTNKHLRNLKGSYDLVDFYSMRPLIMELTRMIKNLPKVDTMQISKKPSFSSLREFFDPEEMVFLDHVCNDAQDWDIEKCDLVGAIYLIEKSLEIFNRYGELFTPFSQLPTSKLRKPYVRKISGNMYSYFLSKEYENAMKAITNQNNISLQFMVETEEERKLGIVNGVIVKNLITHINSFQIPILEVIYEDDLEFNALPIMSSYGTYCVPVWTAFDNVLYYLTVVLRIFQRSNPENLKKVYEWIDDLMDTVFQTKPNFYLIEKWKIDEIIDRARKELSQYLTEPEYQIPYQKEYQRNEVFREIEKLTTNLGMEKQFFIDTFRDFVEKSVTFQIQGVFRAYFTVVRLYFMQTNRKICNFLGKQMEFMNENIDELMRMTKDIEIPIKVENETMFTGFKKGFLNKAKKPDAENKESIKRVGEESDNIKKEQKMDPPKRLADVEDLRKKLEKVEKKNLKLRQNSEIQEKASNSRIEKEILKRKEAENHLETEKNRVKKCETDIQSLREELEQSKKELLKAEKNLKIHLKASTCQIAKLEEELQKTKESENQLTERLEIIGQENLEKINSLANDYENVEREMSQIKNESEIVKKDNQQLNEKIEELEGQNVKNSEFQQKIKEYQNIFEIKHSNIIDSLSSHLRIITAQSVRQAKEEIEMLEETIEEYVENVEKEYEKL